MFKFLIQIVSAGSIILSPGNVGGMNPGYYVVHSDQVSGFVQVTDWDAAFLYEDNGRLYSSPVAVKLETFVDDVTISLPDGRLYSARLEPYKEPDIPRLEDSGRYRKSRYRVSVERNRVYGHALGFWNEYPSTDENALITFGRKTLEWLSSRKDVDLTMDIYSPANDKEQSRPILLMIQGGAFFNGDKKVEGLVRWARHFASLGYVVASINYRLGFRPTSNEVTRAGYRAVQDANAAVRYLLDRNDLAIDPGRVFVAGTSAGAITALNLAYMQDKDRPAITRGGMLGDEGRINSVSPQYRKSFTVRAVGNLWGAVADTAMLFNKDLRIPVISYHSERDPIVPYKSDHPFGSLFNFLEFPIFKSIIDDAVSSFLPIDGSVNWSDVNKWVFPEMHGSYVVDRVLRSRGIHTELHPSKDPRHTLHENDKGEIIENIHKDIQDGMEAFFASEMSPAPVTLRQDPDDVRTFRIVSSDVDKCYWKVENGVILARNKSAIRVLMQAGCSHYSVTVCGTYRSGGTFDETIDLGKSPDSEAELVPDFAPGTGHGWTPVKKKEKNESGKILF